MTKMFWCQPSRTAERQKVLAAMRQRILELRRENGKMEEEIARTVLVRRVEISRLRGSAAALVAEASDKGKLVASLEEQLAQASATVTATQEQIARTEARAVEAEELVSTLMQLQAKDRADAAMHAASAARDRAFLESRAEKAERQLERVSAQLSTQRQEMQTKLADGELNASLASLEAQSLRRRLVEATARLGYAEHTIGYEKHQARVALSGWDHAMGMVADGWERVRALEQQLARLTEERAPATQEMGAGEERELDKPAAISAPLVGQSHSTEREDSEESGPAAISSHEEEKFIIHDSDSVEDGEGAVADDESCSSGDVGQLSHPAEAQASEESSDDGDTTAELAALEASLDKLGGDDFAFTFSHPDRLDPAPTAAAATTTTTTTTSRRSGKQPARLALASSSRSSHNNRQAPTFGPVCTSTTDILSRPELIRSPSPPSSSQDQQTSTAVGQRKIAKPSSLRQRMAANATTTTVAKDGA